MNWFTEICLPVFQLGVGQALPGGCWAPPMAGSPGPPWAPVPPPPPRVAPWPPAGPTRVDLEVTAARAAAERPAPPDQARVWEGRQTHLKMKAVFFFFKHRFGAFVKEFKLKSGKRITESKNQRTWYKYDAVWNSKDGQNWQIGLLVCESTCTLDWRRKIFLVPLPDANTCCLPALCLCLALWPDSLTVSAGLQVCHVCLTSPPCTALCLSVCPPLQPGVASLDRAWVRAAAAKPVARAAATPARRGASPPWVSMVSKTEGWDSLKRLSD